MSGSQKKNNTDNIVYMGRNLPVVSVIDITWSMLLSCNYSCEYCSIRSHDKQYATPDTVKKTIAFIEKSPQEIKNVTLFGGEPTIHPDIIHAVDSLSKFCSNVYVFTNLSCSKSMIKDIKDNGGKFTLTYHPDMVSEDIFLKKLDYLLSIGGDIQFLNIMMYKAKEDEIRKVQKYCIDHGVVHRFPPILGNSIKLRDFVQSIRYTNRKDVRTTKDVMVLYDDMRRALLNKQECKLLNLFDFKGWMCWAGVQKLFISHLGDVYRCKHDDKSFICKVTEEKYPEIKPWICPYDSCNCYYSIFKMNTKTI